MVSLDYDNNYENNNINNSFEGIKFTNETAYFKNPVYDKDGYYIGFVIAESYFKFFLNTGQKDNNGYPLGSFIHKEKENLEWFMNYENEN